jgi:hypothetical protein
LYWQALEDAGVAYTAALQLFAADGVGVGGIDEPVLHGFYQPDFWPTGMTLVDRHKLTLPADLPPGRYRLDLGLYATAEIVDLLPVGDGDRLPLAMLTVDQEIVPPDITPTYLDFGHQIRLLGYDLNRVANDTVRIDLDWQSLQPAGRDYTVFAQVLDSSDNIVAQDDGPPGNPFFPTTTWLPGDIVADARTLSLPAGAPPADYVLLFGLYHQPSGERLDITDAHGESQGDTFRLGPISLGSESP